MLSWPQRKEKVPPSPIPGAAEGLVVPAVDALRVPAVTKPPTYDAMKRRQCSASFQSNLYMPQAVVVKLS